MKINYDSVRRDAKKLRALADDCEMAAKTCSKYQNELSQYWQGTSADSYAAGLAQLNKKNKALASQIEQLAAQIIAVANELEEEDRRLAAQIAARKISGAASSAKTAAYSASAISAAATVANSIANAASSSVSAASTAAAKSSTSTLTDSISNLVFKLFGKE